MSTASSPITTSSLPEGSRVDLGSSSLTNTLLLTDAEQDDTSSLSSLSRVLHSRGSSCTTAANSLLFTTWGRYSHTFSAERKSAWLQAWSGSLPATRDQLQQVVAIFPARAKQEGVVVGVVIKALVKRKEWLFHHGSHKSLYSLYRSSCWSRTLPATVWKQ